MKPMLNRWLKFEFLKTCIPVSNYFCLSELVKLKMLTSPSAVFGIMINLSDLLLYKCRKICTWLTLHEHFQESSSYPFSTGFNVLKNKIWCKIKLWLLYGFPLLITQGTLWSLILNFIFDVNLQWQVWISTFT